MNPLQPNSIEDFQLRNGYDAIRQVLAEPKYHDRHERALANWAQPGDRRLPLVFLGRTIAEMVATSFEEVAATSGVGRKKIAALIGLLHRVAQEVPRTDSPAVASNDSPKPRAESKRKGKKGVIAAEKGNSESDGVAGEAPVASPNPAVKEKFQPADITEANWDSWRRPLERSSLPHEPLGLLAPSLLTLPRSLWHKPASEFTSRTLGEVRERYSEQEVLAVGEVFSSAASLLRRTRDSSCFAIQLCPKFVSRIQAWLHGRMNSAAPTSAAAIVEGLANPLLEQMEIDGGEGVRSAAANWIRQWQPEATSVSRREAISARREVLPCAQIMAVRWAAGRFFLHRFAARMQESPCEGEAVRLLEAICEAYYPDRLAEE